MKFKSIQFKIALWAGACLVIAAAAFISYSAYNTRTLAIEDAKKQATAQARSQATEVKAELESVLNATRALSQGFKAAKDSGANIQLTREEVNGMLRQILEENPDFLAIYSSWEPNVFDGNDRAYAGKQGYNQTGRFNTTFARKDDGKIEINAPRENEEETQDWYQKPKKNMGDTILDPYFYPIRGKETLETSLLSPIVVDGEFLGVVGIDIRIDSLQKQADKFDLYDRTGRLLFISNNGTVAGASSRPDIINKPFQQTFPQLAEYLGNIQRNKPAVKFVDDDLVVVEPFTIGETQTNWGAILLVPKSKITMPALYQLGFQVLLGAGLVIIALIVLWFLASRLAAPIKQAADAANQLSFGVLPNEIPVISEDETGQLAQAMNRMTRYLREMADTSDQVAQGNLDVNVHPRSAQDRFGHSFQRMAEYLQDMARVSDEIAGGNLGVQVRPKSAQDRFGHSFKNMLERTLSLVQSEEERDRIQNSVMKLLQEVSEVSTGDLTVQAEVTADLTGAIADAFNLMLGELRQIIYQVRDTTFQVNQSADRIQAATQELASGSEFQAIQINTTSEAVQAMVASIQDVSGNAALSAAVAEQSLRTSRKGAEAVHTNIDAMGRIREQVQDTAKRIKRLGERSQEIGTSIQLIQDIADRTSMLALNAAIQAANAGEAGRGFVVVAEEIEGLSERTTNAAKQIGSLVQGIQRETNEVVASMEDTTSRVVNGSALASEAGAALQEIESVTQQLAVLIQSISEAAQTQAKGSHDVAQSMTQISRVTRQVELGATQVASSARQLVTQAEALRGSVVAFKLPEDEDTDASLLSFAGFDETGELLTPA
jgi:methyl-accepting chemotaxis protein